MKKLYDTYKHIIRPVFIVGVCSITLFYLINLIATHNTGNPEDDSKIVQYEQIISVYKDSLQAAKAERVQQDTEIVELQRALDAANKKETIIREVYREKIKYVDRYTPSDVTIYFNNRYMPDSIKQR